MRRNRERRIEGDSTTICWLCLITSDVCSSNHTLLDRLSTKSLLGINSLRSGVETRLHRFAYVPLSMRSLTVASDRHSDKGLFVLVQSHGQQLRRRLDLNQLDYLDPGSQRDRARPEAKLQDSVGDSFLPAVVHRDGKL